MTNRTFLRWATSIVLAGSALVFGACFHVGDQTGTCASDAVCSCDGIGNCNESCPGGRCHFECTGVGNCNVSCAGGGCRLDCTGTGNCNLDCSGGSCTSNCLGRTNCVCQNCDDLPDAGVTGDASVAEDASEDVGPTPDADIDVGPPVDAFVVPVDANADVGPDA